MIQANLVNLLTASPAVFGVSLYAWISAVSKCLTGRLTTPYHV